MTSVSWDTGCEKWTLRVGAQASRLTRTGGKLPVKLEVGAYYKAPRPSGDGTWQLFTETALVF